MQHRHINTDTWTVAAIDSVLDRGNLTDWQELFSAVNENIEIAKRVLVVTSHRDHDGASIMATKLVETMHPKQKIPQ